jgi:hypothetical protein
MIFAFISAQARIHLRKSLPPAPSSVQYQFNCQLNNDSGNSPIYISLDSKSASRKAAYDLGYQTTVQLERLDNTRLIATVYLKGVLVNKPFIMEARQYPWVILSVVNTNMRCEANLENQ